jgi:transmembrane sensor
MTAPEVSGDSAVDQASRWYLRLLAAPLAAAESRALQAWIQADPNHAGLLAQAQSAWNAVGEQAAQPRMLRLRLEAIAQLRQAGREARRRRTRYGAAAAVAGVLLAVGLSVFWMLAPRAYRTGIDERTRIVLEDGSSATLDAATEIKVRYTQGRRQLWLERGRASFDVAKDPARPFSVQAAGKRVVATGTRFSVERLDRQMRVVLYEGRVAVWNVRGAARPASLQVAGEPAAGARALRPGQELIASVDTATDLARARVVTVNPHEAQAWENGQLIFRDVPLALAVARVNRYSRTPLRLGDAQVARIRISGLFRAGDTAAFVEGVTAVFAVRARNRADGIVLETAR